VGSRRHSSNKQAAQSLIRLYPGAVRDYLERRIREETVGEHGVEDIED
jgi:hypothetical protein